MAIVGMVCSEKIFLISVIVNRTILYPIMSMFDQLEL